MEDQSFVVELEKWKQFQKVETGQLEVENNFHETA